MLLSSRQTAILLDTHESSVKRWCNAGELPHSTTAGGHRRIDLDDVVAFARRQDVGKDLVTVSEKAGVVVEGVRLLRRGRVTPSLRQVVCDWLLDASSVRVSALFRLARSFDVPLSTLYDDLVAEVLQSVGESWAQGAFAVGEEHRVSESLLDVLYGIQASIEAGLPSRSSQVILGTIEGDDHVTGAMMIRTLLSEAGHPVCYLGRNVPSEDFVLFQKKHQAPLVCLSATLSQPPERLIRVVNQMLSLTESGMSFRIAVGGYGAGAARALRGQLSHADRVRFFDSASDLISWATPILHSNPVTEHESH